MANTGLFGTQPPVYDDRIRFFFIRLGMKAGMKNPYEEKKPEFGPEMLRENAAEMRTVKSKCEHYEQMIRYLVGDLEALWTNDIQTSLTAELGSLQNSLLDYSDLVDEYASFLDFAAEELAANRAAVTLVPAKEENNDEPVLVNFPSIPDLKHTREPLPSDKPFGIPGMLRREPDKTFTKSVLALLAKLGLGRRDGETKTEKMLRVMKYSVLELRSAVTQFNFYVRKMQYLVEELQRYWASDAQTGLIEELSHLESPVKDFANIIEEYAALLDLAIQELETNVIDVDKASVFADVKDGPISVTLSNISYLKRSHIDLKAYDPYFERTQTGVSTVITASKKNAEYIYNVYEDHIELVKYIGLKRTVEIPGVIDGLPVTHIGLDCFAMAWRVKFISITIPESVTTIYHGAFRGCSYIREVKLPKSLKYIGNYAFGFISDLEHIEIPDGVVSLGMGAFRNCAGLKEIVIPDSVQRIGNDCFYTCKSLNSVEIGDGVVEIDDWAFRDCEHLERVAIGSGVVMIGESAFYGDVRLMRLDVPENVEKIGENAFYQRRGMKLGVTSGSAAEKYAKEFKNEVIVVEE
jgi:hypothetical protein